VSVFQREHRQIYLQADQVKHKSLEICERTQFVVRAAYSELCVQLMDIATVGCRFSAKKLWSGSGDLSTISRDDVLKWIGASGLVISENREYLNQLDSAYGDADHGANIDRGFRAAVARIPEVSNQDIGTIFKTVGMALHSTVGGSAGRLYGTFFLQISRKTAGKLELNLDDWCTALQAALNGVMMRGNAEPADKTMVDALFQAVIALKRAAEENLPLEQALIESTAAAKLGMEQTTQLVANKGHTNYLRERSAGYQDPGATSMFLILKAATDTWMNCRRR